MVLPNRRPFDHFMKMLPFTSDEPDLATIIERRDGLERYIQVREEVCACVNCFSDKVVVSLGCIHSKTSFELAMCMTCYG